MDKNQKYFLCILALYVLADFTSVAITNLFIWQQTNQFHAVLIYNMFVFLGMAVSGIGTSFLASSVGNKRIFMLSMVLYIAQFVLLILFGKTIADFLFVIGLVSGFAIGAQSYSYNVLVQEITKSGEREKFFGIKTSLLNTITFLGVPAITYFATQAKSYSPVFLFVSILAFLVILITTLVRPIEQLKPFRLIDTKSAVYRFPDLKSYLVAKFLFGIQNGLFWVVLGIITLQFVGNLFAWGIFSSFLTFITIIAAFIYGRSVDLRSGKYAAVMGTFLFTGVTLILAINWNFLTFVLYQIILVVLTVIMSVNFDSFMASIIEENEETSGLRNELNGIGELFLDLGRLLPILVLLFVNADLNNTLYVRTAFVVVAPLPFLIISALKKIPAFVDNTQS